MKQKRNEYRSDERREERKERRGWKEERKGEGADHRRKDEKTTRRN